MKTELVEAQETAIAIRQETENLIRASLAPNTLKAYQKALKGFDAFLKGNTAEFSDTALSAYLTTLYRDNKSPSTISIVVAAVKWQLRNENKRVVKRYLKKAGIMEGAVFRRIRKGGHVGQERVSMVLSRGIRSGWGRRFRWRKPGQRSLICRSRVGGSRPRCRRIMRKRSWRNGVRLRDSKMENSPN